MARHRRRHSRAKLMPPPRARAARFDFDRATRASCPSSARPRNCPAEYRIVPASFSTARQAVAERQRGIADARRHAPLLADRAARVRRAPRPRVSPRRSGARGPARRSTSRNSGESSSPSSAACRRGAPRRGQSMRALRITRSSSCRASSSSRAAAARERERRRVPSLRRGMSSPVVTPAPQT